MILLMSCAAEVESSKARGLAFGLAFNEAIFSLSEKAQKGKHTLLSVSAYVAKYLDCRACCCGRAGRIRRPFLIMTRCVSQLFPVFNHAENTQLALHFRKEENRAANIQARKAVSEDVEALGVTTADPLRSGNKKIETIFWDKG